MEKQLPMISVIVVNFNSTAVTCELLQSMKLLNYPNFEIIICDMASDLDPSNEFRKSGVPNLRVVRSEVNLGFSGGNNLGASVAQGSFLFFLNNDTEVNESLLHNLIKPMIDDNSIGICCPRIKLYHDASTIEYAGFRPMNMVTGRTSAIGYGQPDNGQYNQSRETAGAHGCAMMIRKETFDQLGGFEERFFLYYEEWDLSFRIRKSGLKIWYEGSAEVLHKSSSTVGKHSVLKTYYLTRNRIYLMNRNASAQQYLLFRIYFILFALPGALLRLAMKAKFSHMSSYLKAVAWNFNKESYYAGPKKVAGTFN